MLSQSDDSIALDLIHLSNNKSAHLYDEKKEIGFRLERVIKQLPHIVSVDLELIFNLDNNTTEKNYYEDENVCRYSGEIVCERKDQKYVKKIITNVCSDYRFNYTWFAFNNDTYKWLSKWDHMNSYDNFSIYSFRFGTLIDLTHFIKHYDSNDRNYYNSRLHVAKDDITADFKHEKKSLHLKFRLTSGGTSKRFISMRHKLEYDYQSFDSIVIHSENNFLRLYINLNHPPILYMLENDIKAYELSPNKRNKYPKQNGKNIFDSLLGIHTDEVSNTMNWVRENEFNGVTAETIGKSNVLVIDIPMTKGCDNQGYRSTTSPDPYSIINRIRQITKIPVYFANIDEHNCVDKSEMDFLYNIPLPFSVNYAYHSLFSHTFQVLDELFFKFEISLFMVKVEELFAINPKALEETLFQMSAIIDSRSILKTLNALLKIFYQMKKKYDKVESEWIDFKSFNTEVQDIRRCILTPTRILLLPPQPILKSRFIVNSEADYSIRLTVREDNLQGLSYTVQRSCSRMSQINFVRKIVKIPLMNGLKIGDRVYEFLGSSSSQLRDNGMILYAKDSCGRTAESIRESVGDMSRIRRNVPKYVARLGLVFSQAMTHIEISDDTKIDVYPDIEGDFKPDFRNPCIPTKDRYVFSDGIGMVSQAIGEKVYKQLPNDCIQRPSAMQIRFGGCKGMLVINPKLKGEHIIFRESMKKYESNDRSLGILKLSAPRPVYLNRPLISILEQLKVKQSVFMGMLIDNFKSLANSLVCECSALTLLQNASSLCIPYEKLFSAGIPFLSEPIFRQIVDCLIPHRIKELKSKARIKVPMNSGRIAFGVLDETGSLEYGQIFAKLSHVSNDGVASDKCFILEGQIMVTKFPCLHPGDVRKLTAVNIPALSHIKDCIVFPTKGPRPHSDEMAGSDLDGDEYAIFWNCDLVFEGENVPAMHFPTGNARELDHEARVEDILDFYCDYILRNNVGLLANAHLANADQVENGIFNKVCMSLAAKYAVALDFAKTGIVEPIEWKERPKSYPDFMEKLTEKKTYSSNKVLGQLYRQCCTFEMGMQSRTEPEIKAKPNPIFDLKNWEQYESSATNAFLLYKEKISYLLNRFGVVNEAALLSGAYSKTTKYMTGRTETSDVHELLESIISKLFHEFNQMFKNECESQSVEENNLRASAWYMTSHKLNQNLSPNFHGFPWTITDELCKIVDKHNATQVHDCAIKCCDSTIDI